MKSIGHYRIEAPLGAGGMGAVYRAYDTLLERTVALKFPGTGAPECGAPAHETERTRLLCDVVVESDGGLALHRARRESFDLILLDVILPHKNGFEICRELRRDAWKTLIILLTAKTQEAERILGLELGADDYVTKPFSPGELRARVKAVLRRIDSSPNPDNGADRHRTIDP